MEQQMDITRVRQRLASIVDDVEYRGDHYVIMRHGEPAAAVVPISIYQHWLKEREELFALVRTMQAANEDADPDEIMQEVLQAQQAVRNATIGQADDAHRP